MSKQALTGQRGKSIVWMDPTDLHVVKNKEHFLYDERAERDPPEEFLASLDYEGIHEPVLVWKNEDHLPVVVDGRQRTAGAIIVNVRRKARGEEPIAVPAIAVKGTPTQLKAMMILANEARVADTPLNVARKTKDFFVIVSGDKHRTAAVFGVTTKTVEARLKILELAPDVQRSVEEGRIGFWAATELHGLPPEEQILKLAEVLEESSGDGVKPSIERVKRKAGKGKSPQREKTDRAKAALLDAALEYGSAREDESGIRETTERLQKAAHAYYRLVEKKSGSES